MSDLRVTIVADGMKREFTGSGSGPELVAVFRSWLSSPDFWFPMCEGADEIDQAAEQVIAPAKVNEQAECESVEVCSGVRDVSGTLTLEPLLRRQTEMDIRSICARLQPIIMSLCDGGMWVPDGEVYRAVERRMPMAKITDVRAVLKELVATSVLEQKFIRDGKREFRKAAAK